MFLSIGVLCDVHSRSRITAAWSTPCPNCAFALLFAMANIVNESISIGLLAATALIFGAAATTNGCSARYTLGPVSR